MMSEFDAYIGLDVHKETVAVAAARAGRGAAEFRCELRNGPDLVARLLERVSEYGSKLSFCYEAGPCGYGLWHELTALGHECVVAAPSLIPRRPGSRVKTDRRDALELARLHRAGELVAVRVPCREDEAVRDLTRAREDMKALELAARNRLNGFLLRHGMVYRDGTRWTLRHWDWLESLEFELPAQRATLLEYLDAARDAGERVAKAGDRIAEAVAHWSRGPLVEALVALRGVDFLAAATLAAELGDICRFDSPRQLMAFVGLVPGEHSSGGKRRPGAITRTGNAHARRMLVEVSWSYRFPARRTAHLRRKAANAPESAKRIAWAAQKRLCGRYLALVRAGKPTQKACTAVARELLGFIWAIARELDGLPHGMRAAA